MIIYLEAGYNLAGGDSTARVHHPVRQIYVAIPSVARSKAVSAVAYFGATGSRPRFWRQQAIISATPVGIAQCPVCAAIYIKREAMAGGAPCPVYIIMFLEAVGPRAGPPPTRCGWEANGNPQHAALVYVRATRLEQDRAFLRRVLRTFPFECGERNTSALA